LATGGVARSLRKTCSGCQIQIPLFDYSGDHAQSVVRRKAGLLVPAGHDRQPVSKNVQLVIRVAFDPEELDV